MLAADSTSSGATMPGKITMSERPRMGSTSGNDLPAREMAVSLPAVGAPRMLMNSVSGEVILWPLSGLDAEARQKLHEKVKPSRSDWKQKSFLRTAQPFLAHPRAGNHSGSTPWPGSNRN